MNSVIARPWGTENGYYGMKVPDKCRMYLRATRPGSDNHTSDIMRYVSVPCKHLISHIHAGNIYKAAKPLGTYAMSISHLFLNAISGISYISCTVFWTRN